jgi:hypothetical protein
MQAFQGKFMFLVCSYRHVYSPVLTYAFTVSRILLLCLVSYAIFIHACLERWHATSAVKPLTLFTQLRCLYRRVFLALAPTDCAHDPLGYALPGTEAGPNPGAKVKLINLSARPSSPLHASVTVTLKERPDNPRNCSGRSDYETKSSTICIPGFEPRPSS